MSSNAGSSDFPGAVRSGRAGLVLIAAAAASLVLAGLLLWQRNADAVFGDMVLAALAWCF